MSHFAKVVDGVVETVIVAEQDYIDSRADAQQWIQTSYNTYGGQHPEGRPLRMNFATIGGTYDAQRDAFIPPKPFKDWLLNNETCLWEPPIPYPAEPSFWDETTGSWVPYPNGGLNE